MVKIYNEFSYKTIKVSLELIKERIPEFICRKINADEHVSVVFTLKQPDCYYHTDVDDLIRPQLPVYVIPELDSDLLPESPDADVFILDASCPYL